LDAFFAWPAFGNGEGIGIGDAAAEEGSAGVGRGMEGGAFAR
jgi:hypothetical protein